MDLNQLFYRHQAALMRAAVARGQNVAATHHDDAAQYAGRSHALRADMGATGVMPLPAAVCLSASMAGGLQ